MIDSIEGKVCSFNNNLLGINRPIGPIEDPKERDWLVGALREEIDEYLDSVKDHDFIGQIDSMVDLIYFAIGGLVRMGLDEDAIHSIFSVVHEANSLKKAGVKAEREHTHNLDATKPKGWVSPEEKISEIIDCYKVIG